MCLKVLASGALQPGSDAQGSAPVREPTCGPSRPPAKRTLASAGSSPGRNPHLRRSLRGGDTHRCKATITSSIVRLPEHAAAFTDDVPVGGAARRGEMHLWAPACRLVRPEALHMDVIRGEGGGALLPIVLIGHRLPPGTGREAGGCEVVSGRRSSRTAQGMPGAMSELSSWDRLRWWRKNAGEAEVAAQGEVSSEEDGELEDVDHAASRGSGSAAGGLMALSSLVSTFVMLCLCLLLLCCRGQG